MCGDLNMETAGNIHGLMPETTILLWLDSIVFIVSIIICRFLFFESSRFFRSFFVGGNCFYKQG